MGRKRIRPPSPVSPIVGYRVNPVNKRLSPSAKKLCVAKRKRYATRSVGLLPEVVDEDPYTDIDEPDLLIGLRGHLRELEPSDSNLGVTNDIVPHARGSQGKSLPSVTRDDLLDSLFVEGLDALLSLEHPQTCNSFITPDDLFYAGSSDNSVAIPEQECLPPAASLDAPSPVSPVDLDALLPDTISALHSRNNSPDEFNIAEKAFFGSGSLLASISHSSNDITLPSSSSRPGSQLDHPLSDLVGDRLSPIITLPVSSISSRSVSSPIPITPSLAAIMAPSEEQVATAISFYLRANDDFIDEYSELLLDYLPVTELSRLRDVFQKHKENLGDAYHTVRACSVDILSKVGSLQAVQDLKKSYIELIAKSFEFEHNRNRQGMERPRSRVDSFGEFSNNPSTTDSIKANRVNSRTNSAAEAALKICDDLWELCLKSPSSHQDLDILEARCESAKALKNEIMPELRELAKTAVSAGLKDQADRLHDAIDTLSDCQRQAIGFLHQAKIALGVPLSGYQRSFSGPTKAPRFSGDFSSEMDFFSFVEAFNEYAGANRIYSVLDKFQRLKADCLTGQARSAVSTSKTFEEAMNILRELFGKSRVLFAHKEQDILSEGKCPSTPLERRTWFISLRNRVVALRELAVDHQILDSFHTSSIFDTIVSSMTEEDRQLYKQRVLDQMLWDPELDQSLKATVNRLINFLSSMTRRAGLEVDYSMSCFDKSEGVLEKINAFHFKPNKTKPPHDKDKEKPKKVSENQPTSSCYQVSPNSDSGSTYSLNPSKGAEQAKVMAQAHAAPLVPIPIQSPGNPIPVTCSLCHNEHTSMAYCKHFQKSKVKDRWGKVCLAGGCFRCLRLDSRFEPGRRREWWEAHKLACNDDFRCVEGDCATKPIYRQFHLTMCVNHITSNKLRQSEFIDSLEPSTSDEPHRFF